MKFKIKNISKILIAGVLFNNCSLNSYAAILSEDGRYETFKESNITINDILEEDRVDIKAEGSTLVNILKDGQSATIQPAGLKDFDLMYDVIPGEEYTIIFNSDTSGVYGGFVSNKSWAGGQFYDRETSVGENKILVVPNVSTSIFRIRHDFNDVNVSDVMLLKGDWTNKEIPGYFEGIQSSFENQLVTQEMVDSGQEKVENLGKYKVEVKTTGKNMLSGWVQGMIHGETGNLMPSVDFVSSNYIPVNPEKSYTYTGLAQAFYYYDSCYNYIGNTITNTLDELSLNLTTPNMCSYVRLRYPLASLESITGSKIDTLDEMLEYPNIFEEGSVVTEYEPYKESINTFYLNSPLLEGDTVEYVNGQAYHVHRYKKIVLDGSENWKMDITDVNIKTSRFRINTLDGYPNGTTLSDKFRTRIGHNESHSDTEYIGLIGSSSNLFINILSSKLPSADINGFKEWLSNNPVTVVYELENPIYEPIKADLSVQLFEGTTYISNNSNIPTILEVVVDRVLNRALEAIEVAKVSPTRENMAIARMWTNLANESIRKDEFQNEINNITDIEDLQLEKKTVTANMDLYVKSENTLSMSLDTNSVTFDGYSGVSDMEKLEAISISINSSLPYSLNAYMPVELSNSDSSNKIPINVLNVRENSSSEYKRFANTIDKIILKGDCEAGNDVIHKIDLKLSSTDAHKADVYKAVIKFEAEQK